MSPFLSRFILCLLVSISLSLTAARAAEPPRMLFLEDAGHDATAPSGTRTGYAILRREHGSFCFYNPHAPSAEPLRLPNAQGVKHTLLPALPESLAKSKTLIDSGILSNAQTLLSADGTVRSITVKAERLSKEDSARIGLSMYLDVWYQQGNASEVATPVRTWRGFNGSQMEYQRLASGRLHVPHGNMLPHAKAVPPTSRHETVIEYSDDIKPDTWHTLSLHSNRSRCSLCSLLAQHLPLVTRTRAVSYVE